MRLAVIPARGGSKRIPRKNIRLFGGKPMIAWSIEAAIASGCFDRVVVSTDDPEISAVAREWGGLVPFSRPAALADDHTGIMPVVRHAIEWHVDQGLNPEHVCCIYPTAPLLEPSVLTDAYERMVRSGSDFCFGVASYGHPIQRALRLDAKGGVSMFSTEHSLTRSQDLEPAFHDAGQFCWGTSAAFVDGRSPFLQKSVAVVLPRHRVVDIDTPEDWLLAEALHMALALKAET
ncbi:pseudaminic acid cytidylyltransferase [Methyloversatilis universalis]|nr:pseudaminic acid cytidylyltransferase [Methyloversatilis universalis]